MANRPNPYQTPFSDSTAKVRQNISSGLTWLVGGVGVLIVCGIILGYLMLAEAPCIKQDCFARNIRIPFAVSIGENVVVFVCENWFVLLTATIGLLVMIERYCSVANKRKIRRSVDVSRNYVVAIYSMGSLGSVVSNELGLPLPGLGLVELGSKTIPSN